MHLTFLSKLEVTYIYSESVKKTHLLVFFKFTKNEDTPLKLTIKYLSAILPLILEMGVMSQKNLLLKRRRFRNY